MSLQIHWHEGLFLTQHHLQQMQRGAVEQFAVERSLALAYPYGLVEARISRDELENMRVRFERLRVVMPSGLVVNYPDNADLPSLDIKALFQKGAGTFRVSLGVPLWQRDRANSLATAGESNARSKLLYAIREEQFADENTGDKPMPVQMRKINARLLLDNDDPSDLEVLPLLRIVRATGEEVGLPRQDPEFVPATLLLAGSPILRDFIRDLVNQVEASRKELLVQLTRGGFSLETLRGLQFEQMMRLRTLNRFAASLPFLIAAPNVSPFQVYLELRELLGELAALHPDRDEFNSLPYDHEDPFPCFKEVARKIRTFLRGSVAPSYMKLEFKSANGVFSITLGDEHIAKPNAYFLAIKTKIDPTKLEAYVKTPDNPATPDKFKLVPPSQARRALRGLVLKEERVTPLELPASNDLHYFRIDVNASGRNWAMVQQERGLSAIWIPGELDFSDAVFTLYMTVPGGQT